MHDGGTELGLAQEALAGERPAGQVRRQHLERRGAHQGRVESEEDNAHASAANLGQHFVIAEPADTAGSVARREKIQRRLPGGGGFLCQRIRIERAQQRHDLMQGAG